MSLCEHTIWFAPAQESKHDLQCESHPLPLQLRACRLLTWKLFHGLGSAVHWSDGYIMLIGLSLWTCWYLIFWWSLIRRPLGRDSCMLTPGWFSFAHELGTGQAVGWCTCQPRPQCLLIAVNGVVHRNNCAITCNTRAQFWWGRHAKNKQTKWCWKSPSWDVNNFHFLSLFSGEP